MADKQATWRQLQNWRYCGEVDFVPLVLKQSQLTYIHNVIYFWIMEHPIKKKSQFDISKHAIRLFSYKYASKSCHSITFAHLSNQPITAQRGMISELRTWFVGW